MERLHANEAVGPDDPVLPAEPRAAQRAELESMRAATWRRAQISKSSGPMGQTAVRRPTARGLRHVTRLLRRTPNRVDRGGFTLRPPAGEDGIAAVLTPAPAPATVGR